MGCLGAYVVTSQQMAGGDYLLAPNGQYSAVMQDDGNVVLCWGRWPDRLIGARWASDTNGSGATSAVVLQPDGNFVVADNAAKGTGRPGAEPHAPPPRPRQLRWRSR